MGNAMKHMLDGFAAAQHQAQSFISRMLSTELVGWKFKFGYFGY